MKTTIRTIILAAAVIFAATSCQKEAAVPETQDRINTGETIQVDINASLGDLVAADGTKATAESVIRLKWEGTETVQVYCGTTKISTDGLTVTPSENRIFAKLSGEITTTGLTSGTSVITFIYSNGCTVSDDGLTFDFSSQDANTPFVAYATLVFDGTATLTDKMVEFKFATSVMKIASTGLGGGTISNATISGINTKVTLTPDAGSETLGIAGSEMSKITITAGIDASSDGARAIITVGLVPDSNAGRNIIVSQTDYINKGTITSSEIKSSTSYFTPTSLFPCGTISGHDYILIAGTKWATQNLAISESGKGQWKSVNLPGTTTPVQIGDYFQWGAYEGYCGKAKDSDNGVLIYTGFNINETEDSPFLWKENKRHENYQFNTSSISPYWVLDLESDSYHYKSYTQPQATLIPDDDVASILWLGDWRMPTLAEFIALKEATYWVWDDTDLGYYVFASDGTNEAGSTGSSIPSDMDKSSALLFFPAAGYGEDTSLVDAGSQGYYWSSTLRTRLKASYIRPEFRPEDGVVLLSSSEKRCCGLSVRPVSD